MPSYVIHYICGNKLIENYKVTPKEKSLFLVGNLIPDSSKIFGNVDITSIKNDFRKIHRKEIQTEKLTTHFRRKEDRNNVVMLPYPEQFKNKYGITDLVTLGYYYHLYTDKYFFNDIFKKSFEFLDNNLEITSNNNEAIYVRIKKNNKVVSKDEFFSTSYLYHDYTVMNKLLLEYFRIMFNENELREYINEIENNIEEVDFKNIESVIRDTLLYIEESKNTDDTNLKVFDKNIIINFINELNNNFYRENKQLIKKVGLKNVRDNN